MTSQTTTPVVRARRYALAAIGAAALAATTGIAAATASVPVTSMAAATPLSPSQVGAADQSALLALHTKARQEVGVPPLTWDSSLAADAQAWANELVKGTQIRHGGANEPLSGRAKGEGENLAQGSASFTLTQLAEGWYAEKADYEKAGRPAVPAGIFAAGHYTQMVWSSSTRLGCGTAVYASGQTALVCRYSPLGNWTGERPYGNPTASGGTGQSQGKVNAGFSISGSVGTSLRTGTVSSTAPVTTPPGGATASPAATTTAATTTAGGAGYALLAATCPNVGAENLPATEAVATVRCLVNYFRSLKGLPALAGHASADSVAESVAGGRVLSDQVRTGLLGAVCTGSAGAVVTDRAADARTPAEAMLAFASKPDAPVRSTSGTILGFGVSGNNYGIALVTCPMGAKK